MLDRGQSTTEPAHHTTVGRLHPVTGGRPDRRSSAAADAPASAVSPSTAIPLTNCARVDPVAPGNRSASDRRNECEAVPQPNAVDAATPAMIAWSRLARESKFG